jgi:hypothetical protein
MSREMACRGQCYTSRDFTIVAHTSFCAVVLEAQQPVDRAGAMENAQSAFPTAPWTAHRTRRPTAHRHSSSSLVLKTEKRERLQ